MNTLFYGANKEPILTEDELAQISKIFLWAQMHDDCMLFSQLVTVPRLVEFVYLVVNTASGSRKRPMDKTTRVPVDRSPLATNTQGATLWKDKGKAKVVDNGKSKVIDKGKANLSSLKDLSSSYFEHVGSLR